MNIIIIVVACMSLSHRIVSSNVQKAIMHRSQGSGVATYHMRRVLMTTSTANSLRNLPVKIKNRLRFDRITVLSLLPRFH